MVLSIGKLDAQDIEAAKILLQFRGNFERTLELKLDQNPHYIQTTDAAIQTDEEERIVLREVTKQTDFATNSKAKPNNIFCNRSRKQIEENNGLHDDTDYKADAEEEDEDKLQETEILRKSEEFSPQTNGRRETMVPIGLGKARVSSRVLKKIDWNGSYTTVTRKLLTAVFPRSVLATHSLTGKQSPAFPNKLAKRKLDPLLVDDIVRTVVDRCNVKEAQVRTSITTKCADESKMLRKRLHNNNNNNGRKESSCSS